jgi:hypothetical protein
MQEIIATLKTTLVIPTENIDWRSSEVFNEESAS